MNLITRYQPAPNITTHRQMFNALAHELQLSPAIADEIWCGARVDLMDLKLHAQEKLKVKNNGKTKTSRTSR